MRLSKNFVLSEITRSNTARRLNISNAPNEKHLHNLQMLVGGLIQPMRDDLGPIRISSGYRNPELNRICNFGKMVKCVIKKFMTIF